MFQIDFGLYLGDLGTHKAKVTGIVTDSFGEITVRVTSCVLKFGSLIPTQKERSLECLDLVDYSTRKDLEIAILEHYNMIKDKYSGQPDDYPRDEMETPA